MGYGFSGEQDAAHGQVTVRGMNKETDRRNNVDNHARGVTKNKTVQARKQESRSGFRGRWRIDGSLATVFAISHGSRS